MTASKIAVLALEAVKTKINTEKIRSKVTFHSFTDFGFCNFHSLYSYHPWLSTNEHTRIFSVIVSIKLLFVLLIEVVVSRWTHLLIEDFDFSIKVTGKIISIDV